MPNHCSWVCVQECTCDAAATTGVAHKKHKVFDSVHHLHVQTDLRHIAYRNMPLYPPPLPLLALYMKHSHSSCHLIQVFH